MRLNSLADPQIWRSKLEVAGHQRKNSVCPVLYKSNSERCCWQYVMHCQPPTGGWWLKSQKTTDCKHSHVCAVKKLQILLPFLHVFCRLVVWFFTLCLLCMKNVCPSRCLIVYIHKVVLQNMSEVYKNMPDHYWITV